MKIITWYHITTIGIGIIGIGGVFAGKMLELAITTDNFIGVGFFFFLAVFTMSIGLAIANGGLDERKNVLTSVDKTEGS